MWFDMKQEPLAWADGAPASLRNEAVLDAPPDEVFAVWADIAQLPLWFPDIRSAEWVTEGEPGVGSERVVHLGDLSVRERMLAWEPGARFAFAITAATLPLASRLIEDYRLEPMEGGRSRLTWTVSYELRWFVRPVGFLARRKFGGMFAATTASLADYVARAAKAS